MRIDKLLWFLRFTKTRPLAQAMAAQGHIRVNGHRILHAHHKVALGDILTFPIGTSVRVIEVLSLPTRRGPSNEAMSCYRMLDGNPALPIAAPPLN